MSDAPKEVWCKPYLGYDYVEDWVDGSWSSRTNYGGVKYVKADRIEELEAKLAKAVDVLGYYARNDDGGSIARTTLAELTGGNDD